MLCDDTPGSVSEGHRRLEHGSKDAYGPNDVVFSAFEVARPTMTASSRTVGVNRWPVYIGRAGNDV